MRYCSLNNSVPTAQVVKQGARHQGQKFNTQEAYARTRKQQSCSKTVTVYDFVCVVHNPTKASTDSITYTKHLRIWTANNLRIVSPPPFFDYLVL